jgi:hypothetical protein
MKNDKTIAIIIAISNKLREVIQRDCPSFRVGLDLDLVVNLRHYHHYHYYHYRYPLPLDLHLVRQEFPQLVAPVLDLRVGELVEMELEEDQIRFQSSAS